MGSYASPDPPHDSHSFCPSPSQSGQSSLILPSPLHSGQRTMIPLSSRIVPSPRHLSQSTSMEPTPSQSAQSILPLPSQSLHCIKVPSSYDSGLWSRSLRTLSMAPSQLANAFPYTSNFSGSFSIFIAKFTSRILARRVCSESSRMLSATRRVSCSAERMMTTGRLHFGQKVSLPLRKSGVPHCGQVSDSIAAPDLRSSAILLTSIPTVADHV